MKLVQSWSLFHKAAQPLNHLYPLLSHVEHIWRLTYSQLCHLQICPTFTSRPCKNGHLCVFSGAFLAGSVLTAHRAVRHQSVVSLSVSGREAGPPCAGLDISWWEHELLKIFSFLFQGKAIFLPVAAKFTRWRENPGCWIWANVGGQCWGTGTSLKVCADKTLELKRIKNNCSLLSFLCVALQPERI